jgi:GAF domain-containing protein
MNHTESETTQTNWLTDILTLGNQLRSLDCEAIAQDTVDMMSRSLSFEQVALYLIDKGNPADARPVAQSSPETSSPFPSHRFEPPAGVEQLEHCCLILAPGTDANLGTSEEPAPWHSKDRVLAPLMAIHGLLGYILLDRPYNGQRPTRGMLDVIDIMAGQAAMAFQNARLYATADRATDERLAELATLQEIDRQIHAKLDLHHVLETTLDWAMHTTAAIAGTIALLEKAEIRSPADANWTRQGAQATPLNSQQLRVIAHRGYPPEMEKHWNIPWPADQGLAGRVIQTGEMALTEDVVHDAEYEYHIASPQSHLAMPIKHKEQVVGVISLEGVMSKGFTAD